MPSLQAGSRERIVLLCTKKVLKNNSKHENRAQAKLTASLNFCTDCSLQRQPHTQLWNGQMRPLHGMGKGLSNHGILGKLYICFYIKIYHLYAAKLHTPKSLHGIKHPMALRVLGFFFSLAMTLKKMWYSLCTLHPFQGQNVVST